MTSVVHSSKDATDQSMTPPVWQETEHTPSDRSPVIGLTVICPAKVSTSGQSVQPESIASLKSKCASSPCQVLCGDAAERVTTHQLLATPGFWI